MTTPIITRETVFHDEDGEFSGRNVDEYVGDQLVSTTSFDADGSCASRIDYAYDARGNNVLRLVRWGATRLARLLVFDHDEQGREVSYREYDAANQLVETHLYELTGPTKAIQRVFGADGVLRSEKEMERVGGAYIEVELLEKFRSSESEDAGEHREREGAGEPQVE